MYWESDIWGYLKQLNGGGLSTQNPKGKHSTKHVKNNYFQLYNEQCCFLMFPESYIYHINFNKT